MKGYLQSYAEHFRTRKLLGNEPTQPTIPGCVGCVGNKSEDLRGFEAKNRLQEVVQIEAENIAKIPLNQTDKTDNTPSTTVPDICPLCGATLKADDTAAISR